MEWKKDDHQTTKHDIFLKKGMDLFTFITKTSILVIVYNVNY